MASRVDNMDPNPDVRNESPGASTSTYHDSSNDVVEKTEEKDSIPLSPESKKARKKLLRDQRYEAFRERRRENRKLSRKRVQEQRNEMRTQGVELPRKKAPRIRMNESSCKLRVVVDCCYDDLMSVKDVAKLNNQIGNCYGANRRAANPLQFYVTGVNGKLLERLESPIIKGEYKSWDVNFHQEQLTEVFPVEQVVYLTAESDVTIGDLDPDYVYVIGGLVDHNHHKGFCHKRAQDKGWKTARLPIGEHIQLSQRAVLSIVHVFEAMLTWTETRDWTKSLMSAIPSRKMIPKKEEDDEDVLLS